MHEAETTDRQLIDAAYLITPGIHPEFEELTPTERQEIGRYVQPEDRRDRLAARALLRRMLAARYGVPAGNWRFEREFSGRPRIAHPSAFGHLHFNITHTRGFVACVLGGSWSVGIDAEVMLPRQPGFGTLLETLAADERTWITHGDAAGSDHRFYSCWTLKEAWTKALGLGHSVPFDSFSILPGPKGYVLRGGGAFEMSPAQWRFLRWSPIPGISLAIAARCPRAQFRIGSGADFFVPNYHCHAR